MNKFVFIAIIDAYWIESWNQYEWTESENVSSNVVFVFN